MKRLKPTTQYRKDYKRFRNNPKKLAKLFNILRGCLKIIVKCRVVDFLLSHTL